MKATLFLAFYIIAALFLITICIQFALHGGNYQPYLGSFIIKTIPIWILAFISHKFVTGIRGKILTTGVLFCSMGDIWLDLGREEYFIFGLGSFLIGHLFYIGAFSMQIKINKARFLLCALYVIFAASMAYILWNSMPAEFRIPVIVYLSVITAMACLAALRKMSTNELMLGAIIFMISDTLIAVNKFLVPIPFSSLYIMITYYLGQYLIVKGNLDE